MTIKVSIIGSGFGMYGLLPAFSKINGCKVVSIYGEKSKRMKSYCEKYGNIKIYSNWKQMLQSEKPNAVCIAVVPKYQYIIAKYAINNGMAVFAEKPLTISVSESVELCTLAKKTNLPNMVDFIFPEIPEWIAAKKIIDADLLGKILDVSVDWNFLSYDLRKGIRSWKTDVKKGGGALSFFFSHVFYYLEYFMGRIIDLRCITSTSKKSLNNGETIINTIISFEDGCVGSARMNIAYIGKQKHTIEFRGEHGTLTLRNNTVDVVKNFELILSNEQGIRKIKSENVIPDEQGAEDSRIRPVNSLAMRFINWCTFGTPATPNFRDGLRVQKLIQIARISNSKFKRWR